MVTLCIELNKGEFLENKVVRVEKGWKLHFTRGENVYGKAINLRIVDTDYNVSFSTARNIKELDSQIFHEFKCENFGAFKYEFFEENNCSKEAIGCGYFAVVPEWKIGGSNKILSLNSLCVVTYLTKLLGPLNEWEERLTVAKESRFNVLHLTPVQKLGISNSSYSIAEYDQLNPILKTTFDDLQTFLNKIEHEWGMLTIQDVVWNHSAKNAKWLHEHPECAYNLLNSPHLRPAYILDRALQQFSREIAEGKWESAGLPPLIDNESQLPILRRILMDEIFPKLRLHEFFQINNEKLLKNFIEKLKDIEFQKNARNDFSSNEFNISSLFIQDSEFSRLNSTIDFDLAIKYFAELSSNLDECVQKFDEFMANFNQKAIQTMEDNINTAINAIIGHVAYERVAMEGPRLGKITQKCPLISAYFLQAKEFENRKWEEDEKLAYDPSVAQYLMAFNGWIMNADPLVNFAEWPSQVYLRRELVCWGDSVKLKYGNGPVDCPFLWAYMQKYTEQCARIFRGFRIDNCHSTPIHVAEYFLKAARRIRKDLYVVAELFTGSEEMDNLFVNRLGITSLIREAQNAPDSHEQGRFIYRYGGDAVGAFHHKSTRPAPWGVSHALFYDQTHDNPSPVQKRTVYDFLPTAAMCSISYCASGTVRGYDEFVPHNIDVVKEARLYRKWEQFDERAKGMIRARSILNDLHFRLSADGFSEIFVDQVDENIVAITRHNPKSHESVLLIANTCFSASKFKWTPECRPLKIDDEIVEILFELKTVEEEDNQINGIATQNGEADFIGGLPNFHVECFENVPFNKSDSIEIVDGHQIRFKLFLSGSVVALKINPKKTTKLACASIEQIVGGEKMREEIKLFLRSLSLHDFNFLMNRCEPEERVEMGQSGYEIANFGKLPYSGLQGLEPILQRIRGQNDLGHPLCGNIRQGLWLKDFLINRLKKWPSLKQLAEHFDEAFLHLDSVPAPLRPCYFEMLFSYFYVAIEEILLEKFFSKPTTIPRIILTERLCIASNAFLAHISNSLLTPLLDARDPVLSLSAGLPHFAEGIWRNWGRDTFIALPGILLQTGRHSEARDIILAYAGTLRHGLIPNLLAEGKAPRYNCRDAVWFWLVAIIRYAEMVVDGPKIFNAPVYRLYPTDEAEYMDAAATTVEPLYATMYEALCRHFDGINFRERNAGPRIDEHMKDEGFNVRAYIDHSNGLVFGGNRWNCGTWMDKMGSSERAQNRGEPATSRDGAAVELQGLALRVARALGKYSEQGQFPHSSLKSGDLTWTWEEWASKIADSFDQHFFVDENCTDKFVNRKGIIKDSFGSTQGFTDFQLRPNFCIALDAVPDIVAPEKAWSALKITGKVLAANAPLGICTLDTEDWAYNGNYNNDDDGWKKATAKGWNYHQGPEWLWIAGVYMGAKLKVASLLTKNSADQSAWTETLEEVRTRLFRFEKCIAQSDWASLPELTNRGGQPCLHSCPAQAWSIGCAIEAVCTLAELMDEKNKNE